MADSSSLNESGDDKETPVSIPTRGTQDTDSYTPTANAKALPQVSLTNTLETDKTSSTSSTTDSDAPDLESASSISSISESDTTIIDTATTAPVYLGCCLHNHQQGCVHSVRAVRGIDGQVYDLSQISSTGLFAELQDRRNAYLSSGYAKHGLNSVQSLGAGVVSGVVARTVTAPLELIKTLFQLQHSPISPG
ncbi:hypothetical protein SARC_17303, partial [Sphaeroforma arctica JP610]